MRKDYNVFEVLKLTEKATQAIHLHHKLIEKGIEYRELAKTFANVEEYGLEKVAITQAWACVRGQARAYGLAHKLLDEIFEFDEDLAERLDWYLTQE